MSHLVTINAGVKGVVLPNGLRYNGGAQVLLSDEEYSILSAGFKSAYLSSDAVQGGLQRVEAPVAGGISLFSGTQSNGTDTGVNTRSAYTAVGDMGLVQAVYANIGISTNGETTPLQGPGSPVTITAAIEYPSGTIIPLTFGGQISATLAVAGMVTSDSVNIFIPAGATYWIRTFATVASGGKWWPSGRSSGGSTSSGGTAQTDLTQSGTITGNYATPFGPVAVRQQQLTSNTLRIAVMGDSITGGYTDSVANTPGWVGRAFAGYRYLQQGQSGEKITFGSAETLHTTRLAAARGCNAGFACYGTNDFFFGVTAAVFEQNLISLFRQMAAQGMTCYGVTLVPRTTSTDNFATTANQTVTANESVRVAFNDWARAGMPLNASTLAPVAIGTPGAITAGQSGHPVLRVYDLCSACETTQDSGLWKVNGTAQFYTTDGTHPSAASYASMAALISVPQILGDLGAASLRVASFLSSQTCAAFLPPGPGRSSREAVRPGS